MNQPELITETHQLLSHLPALPVPWGIGRTSPTNDPEKAICGYLMGMSSLLAQVKSRLPIPDHCAFVARFGCFYQPGPLPPRMRPRQIGRCFQNTQELVLRRRDLVYVEGYALGGIPVLHAWATDAQGRVIDQTWAGRHYPDEHPAYYGVPISRAYLKKHRATAHRCLCLIDDWRAKWPILATPHTEFLASPADFNIQP